MKTILVPTDFSSHATNAALYAAALAAHTDAKLVLYHAYHVPLAVSEYSVIMMPEPAMEVEIARNFQQLLKQVQAVTPHISIETVMKEELMLDGIQRMIKENDTDLLVMGTIGARGLEEMLIGSHSSYVLEHVNCPVLIVPACMTKHHLAKIIYATDFQFKDFSYINQLIEIARPYRAEIIITHVSTKKEQEEELMSWFREIAEPNIAYPYVTFKSFHGENVVEELNHAIKYMEADLVCMATTRRKFMDKLFKSSLTKKMSYHCEVPLLAYQLGKSDPL